MNELVKVGAACAVAFSVAAVAGGAPSSADIGADYRAAIKGIVLVGIRKDVGA
jgi:hypothetical protein